MPKRSKTKTAKSQGRKKALPKNSKAKQEIVRRSPAERLRALAGTKAGRIAIMTIAAAITGDGKPAPALAAEIVMESVAGRKGTREKKQMLEAREEIIDVEVVPPNK